MKYFLNFLSDNYGRHKIDEPIGMAEIDFNIKQEQGRMARDFSLNGDVVEFEFSYMRNHQLKQILYYFNKFGFEARVNLEIEIDDNNTYISELDFAQSETDDLESFKCKGILVADRQIIKRRKSVKVDLFSDKNIDGDYIPPLIPDNTLVLATPLKQISIWEGNTVVDTVGRDGNYNLCQNLTKSEIEDSFVSFSKRTEYGTGNPNEDFQLVKAKNNLSNIRVEIKNVFFDISNVTANNDVKIILFVDGEEKIIDSRSGKLIYLSESYIIDIPFIAAGKTIAFYIKWNASRLSGAGPVVVSANIKTESITISADATAYNSIVPSVSLYDAMKQVIKSISGLDIIAPRFDIGGSLYGNRLMNGNALRNIPNKPFSVSLEDIEKGLNEMKCDYEIGADGKVFFGSEVDFYTSSEIGFFPNTQFSEMSKTFNPLYSVNEFTFKFGNYQALKENTVPGTADTIHGESRYVFHNKKVENKKVVDVEWTRDILLIEELRKIGLKIGENTSTQDDDDIFILDTVSTIEDQTFNESIEVMHSYDVSANRLILRNDNSFNFVVLGIYAGSSFEILAPDNNTAQYTVYSSTPNELVLTRVSAGSNSAINDGLRITNIKYTIDDAVIPFTNRTNQGFDTISNLNAGDKCSNLRYTVGRNIRNFWWSYLSTVNLYWKNESIKNTWYKNNGECTTVFEGVTVKEKDNITPNNPILTPMLYNKMIFSNVEFLDFVTLSDNLRTDRGFIRAIDNNEKVIKVYPTELMYSMLDRELTVKGEEKYEPITMTISTANPYILINNETTTDSVITEIKGEKLYIYDLNRQLLYNGVYWYEVAINGALASNKNELQGWLDLLP